MSTEDNTYHELVTCHPQDFADMDRSAECFVGPALQCATCDKPFLFEWRMLQHQRAHLLPFLRRSLSRRLSGDRVVCTLSIDTASVPLKLLTSTEPLSLSQARIRGRERFNDKLDVLLLVGDKSLSVWPRRRAYECRLCHLQFGLKRAAIEHAKQHSLSARCNFCGLDCVTVDAKLAHERRQHKEDIRKAVKARRMSKAAKVKADSAAESLGTTAAAAAATVPAQTFHPHLEAPLAGAAFAEQYNTILQCQNCHYCFTSLSALTEHMTFHCQHVAHSIGAEAGQHQSQSLFEASESLRLVSSNELQCIQGLYHLRGAAADEIEQEQQQQPIYYVDSSAIDPRLYMPLNEAYHVPLDSLQQHHHLLQQQQQQQFFYAYPHIIQQQQVQLSEEQQPEAEDEGLSAQ